MAFGQPSLKGRALRWLAQREHTRAELARKLARVAAAADVDAGAGAAADPEEARAHIDRLLDELAAAGLLSDARAAESVLASQAPRFGGRRLKQVLQAKGLPPTLVAETLAQARGSELERAREVWRKRFGMPAPDAATRAKQMRFLAGRGFEGDIIRRVVQGPDEE